VSAAQAQTLRPWVSVPWLAAWWGVSRWTIHNWIARGAFDHLGPHAVKEIGNRTFLHWPTVLANRPLGAEDLAAIAKQITAAPTCNTN
jgi:hypothetical protein